MAALCGGAGVVQRLLDAGADINAKDEDSRTPLHKAAAAGRDRIVEVLIASGAELDARDANGRTPLDRARANRHRKAAERLVTAGATSSGQLAHDQSTRLARTRKETDEDLDKRKWVLKNSPEVSTDEISRLTRVKKEVDEASLNTRRRAQRDTTGPER